MASNTSETQQHKRQRLGDQHERDEQHHIVPFDIFVKTLTGKTITVRTYKGSGAVYTDYLRALSEQKTEKEMWVEYRMWEQNRFVLETMGGVPVFGGEELEPGQVLRVNALMSGEAKRGRSSADGDEPVTEYRSTIPDLSGVRLDIKTTDADIVKTISSTAINTDEWMKSMTAAQLEKLHDIATASWKSVLADTAIRNYGNQSDMWAELEEQAARIKTSKDIYLSKLKTALHREYGGDKARFKIDIKALIDAKAKQEREAEIAAAVSQTAANSSRLFGFLG